MKGLTLPIQLIVIIVVLLVAALLVLAAFGFNLQQFQTTINSWFGGTQGPVTCTGLSETECNNYGIQCQVCRSGGSFASCQSRTIACPS